MSENQPLENPYDGPFLRFHSDTLLEAERLGTEISGQLLDGDSRPLPDGVLDFLKKHTEAINIPNVEQLGTFRKHIADTVATAEAMYHTPVLVHDIGNYIAILLQVSTRLAPHLQVTDVVVNTIWDDNKGE